MFCRKTSWDAAGAAQLYKVCALERALREKDAVVGQDADGVAHDPGETTNQGLAVERLELVQTTAVNCPRDDFSNVVALPVVARDDTVEFSWIVKRLLWLLDGPGRRLLAVQVLYDGADYCEGMLVVFGEVVGDAREAGVNLGAAELLRANLFAGRCLDEGGAAEEDRTRPLYYDYLVAHRRHVRSPGRATPHHRGDLGYAPGAHLRLVVEDAPEVLPVGEDLVLQWQERAA